MEIPTLDKEKFEEIYSSDDTFSVEFYIEKEFINDDNGELNLSLTEGTLEVRDSFETVIAITKLNENKITKRVNVKFNVIGEDKKDKKNMGDTLDKYRNM